MEIEYPNAAYITIVSTSSLRQGKFTISYAYVDSNTLVVEEVQEEEEFTESTAFIIITIILCFFSILLLGSIFYCMCILKVEKPVAKNKITVAKRVTFMEEPNQQLSEP